jgi:hypothetical protein
MCECPPPDRRSRRARPFVASIGAALTVTANVAFAAGQLDPAFANGQVASLGLGGLRYPFIAVARDGRILLGGTVMGGSFLNVRYGAAQMFDDAGTMNPGFGGEYGFSAPSHLGLPTNHSLEAAAFDGAGRALVGGTMQVLPPGGWIQRLRSDGTASSTFAPTAPSDFAPAQALQSLFALAVDAGGRIAGGGSTIVEATGVSLGVQGPAHSVVILRHADGTHDLAFGALGERVIESPQAGVDARVRALGFDDHGIVVAHGTGSRLVLQRLLAGGAIDATFGTGGSTTIDGWKAVVVDRIGRPYVLAGPDDARTLARYVEGRLDPAFGGGAAVPLPAPYKVLATGPDGAAYAGRVEAANGIATHRIVRVRGDGIVDAAYGIAGEAIASFDHGANGGSSDPALAVDDAGRLAVAAVRYVSSCLGFFCSTVTSPMLYRFTGPSSPPATALAVEYLHAGFGHYFSTADADEISALDAGVFEGWARTGETFTVAARSVGEASPACRFFSGSTFAPKSSHFYTPYPGECDTVDASIEWGFEKIAYLLRIPDGVGAGNGTCPAGLRPLYRAYNGMQGGAPNHRYTTSPATLDAMLAAGWFLEGEANTRVFACVPL